MKGYIEVTDNYKEMTVFLPLRSIQNVFKENDGTAFICTYYDGENECGIYTVESYDEVKEKIRQSEVKKWLH